MPMSDLNLPVTIKARKGSRFELCVEGCDPKTGKKRELWFFMLRVTQNRDFYAESLINS